MSSSPFSNFTIYDNDFLDPKSPRYRNVPHVTA